MNLEYLFVMSRALSFLFLDIGRLSTKSRHKTDSSILGYLIGYSDPHG
jgi:hypothetical protein